MILLVRMAVILPIDEYQRLLVDVHDLAVVAERRHEQTITGDEVLRRLKSG
jgi:hypothetical protein